MATKNPFDLLGDDDNDDPSQLIAAAQQQKLAAKKPAPVASATPAAAKLPTKPLPPAQAVREAREARTNAPPARGVVGRGGLGRGRGGRIRIMGSNLDLRNENSNGVFRSYGGGAVGGDDGDADRLQDKERPPRQTFNSGHRGGYGGRGGNVNEESGGDSERPPRRIYERRSGTGRGSEVKRQGAGRGNWGTVVDETIVQEKDEILQSGDKNPTDGHQEQERAQSTEEGKDNKEDPIKESEEKEDKEMTLEEYEKILDEKRKALLAMKAEERKVEIDEELQSMQLLSTKKEVDPIFVKLGSDKDLGKKKENVDRDERSKKSLSINEFLKPADGRQYGRGRGRGRGDRGPFRGTYGNDASSLTALAPSIEDPSQFPTLGRK